MERGDSPRRALSNTATASETTTPRPSRPVLSFSPSPPPGNCLSLCKGGSDVLVPANSNDVGGSRESSLASPEWRVPREREHADGGVESRAPSPSPPPRAATSRVGPESGRSGSAHAPVDPRPSPARGLQRRQVPPRPQHLLFPPSRSRRPQARRQQVRPAKRRGATQHDPRDERRKGGGALFGRHYQCT